MDGAVARTVEGGFAALSVWRCASVHRVERAQIFAFRLTHFVPLRSPYGHDLNRLSQQDTLPLFTAEAD
jgi:hypothetical protein